MTDRLSRLCPFEQCPEDCPGYVSGFVEQIRDEQGVTETFETEPCSCACHDDEPGRG